MHGWAIRDGASIRAFLGMLSAIAAVAMSGCASGTPTDPTDPPDSPPPAMLVPAAPGPVMTEGLVLQRDDQSPMLCLGMIAESWPPQCTGPTVIGWDWETAPEPKYHESGVRWGGFALSGRWDGVSFTVTEPPRAESDVDRSAPDPRRDPKNPGPGDAAEVDRIQRALQEQPWGEAIGLLYAFPDNGYLWVTVLYDDGSILTALEERYGSGTIIVVSAIRDA